jgi:hypothetical protein
MIGMMIAWFLIVANSTTIRRSGRDGLACVRIPEGRS